MELEQFKQASRVNGEILQKCLRSRKTDLSNIIFWEDGITGKDLSFDQLLAKSYDILACCAIGAIPSIKKTGADGFVYFADNLDTPHEVETKLCAVESKNIHVGSRGGLYWSSDPDNNNNRASLNSYFSGKFDSSMSLETLRTKARHTALVCFDRDQNSVIDAWVMSPQKILNELKERQHNSTITVKLSRFLDVGVRMGTRVSKIGWYEWQSQQTKLARENKRYI